VLILPFMENRQFYQAWSAPNANRDILAATVLPELVCPDDRIPANPVQHGGTNYYGLTSYGGCGGTRSFRYNSANLKTDGMFFETGKNSHPNNYQTPIRIKDIVDGASHTIMFGERNHLDQNFDSFADRNWEQHLGEYGFWTGSCGNYALADVTLSSFVKINYQLPFNYANRKEYDPPITSTSVYKEYADMRLCAFGSRHPFGANFAFADGATIFIKDDIELEMLQALTTRAGKEILSLSR
jgi:prepilin-type processing-associated H-X9-DG protein